MEKTACPKCGWETDSSKAFCPDCGEPLVAEQKREQSSEFVEAGKTKQFSASVFNMILNADEKPAEAVPEAAPVQTPEPPPQNAPVPPPVPAPKTPSVKVRQGEVSALKPLSAPKAQPAALASPPAPAAESQPSPKPADSPAPKRRAWLKWVLILLALAFFLLIVLIGVGGFIAWRFLDLRLPI